MSADVLAQYREIARIRLEKHKQKAAAATAATSATSATTAAGASSTDTDTHTNVRSPGEPNNDIGIPSHSITSSPLSTGQTTPIDYFHDVNRGAIANPPLPSDSSKPSISHHTHLTASSVDELKHNEEEWHRQEQQFAEATRQMEAFSLKEAIAEDPDFHQAILESTQGPHQPGMGSRGGMAILIEDSRANYYNNNRYLLSEDDSGDLSLDARVARDLQAREAAAIADLTAADEEIARVAQESETERVIEEQRRRKERKKKGIISSIKKMVGRKAPLQHTTSTPNLSSSSSAPPNSRATSLPPALAEYQLHAVDVDNMSYEDLLALQEEIGEVKSHGLTPAEIGRLPISVYVSSNPNKKSASYSPSPSIDDITEKAAIQSITSTQSAVVEVSPGQEAKKKKKGLFSAFKRKKDKPRPTADDDLQMRPSSSSPYLSPQPPPLPKHPPHHQPSAPGSPVISPYPSTLSDDDMDEEGDIDHDRDVCCVCLELFIEGDRLMRLPCFHLGHATELDRWLSQRSTCPICKFDVHSTN